MLKKLLAVCVLFFSALSWAAAIDVNKANEAELTQIKGIGPATATKIVEARKQGAFKSWDDLIDRVKGVGKNNADKFSEAGLTVDGKPYKTPAKASADSVVTSKAAAKTPEPAVKGAKN